MQEPGLDKHEWESESQGLEARRITQLADTGETVDPGDIGLAVQAYRTLYASLLELGPTSDARV